MRLTANPLAALRLKAGFTSAGWAALRLRCSAVHLWNIERGRAGAGEKLVARMARLYRVSPKAIEAAMVLGQKRLMKRKLAFLKEA